MSSDDPVRPYHAEPRASGQEAADVLAAALKHAQERDRAVASRPAPKKQPRWMLPLGINLAVFAVYLLIAPPAWVTVSPIEAPGVVKRTQDMRAAMYMQAQRIEGYRQANDGVLPPSIEALGSTPYQGVDYVLRGDHFQLVAVIGDETVVYDSSSPDPSFASSVERALAASGG